MPQAQVLQAVLVWYVDVKLLTNLQAMDALPNNEFVNVVIVFLGSPAYIKNAHLRAKLIDVRP
jgi:Ubiquitin elongating factor core